MSVLVLTASIVGGYLIGAVSFARIIAKAVIPEEDLSDLDIEIEGSERRFRFRAISATVIRKKAGPKYGCLTSILDMVKALVPTLALRLVFPEEPYYLFSAAAAVVGHDFPVYYGFRGGRGLSPIYGGLLAIDWIAIPVTTAVGSIIGVFVFRYILMAYFGVTLLMIPWLWYRFGDWPHLVYALTVNVCFWVASIPELREYREHLRSGDFTGDHYFIHPSADMTGPLAKWLKKKREERNARKKRRNEEYRQGGTT